MYIQGAGDDEESWSKGLTWKMFWRHIHDLITHPNPEILISSLCLNESKGTNICRIGNTGIFIGDGTS